MDIESLKQSAANGPEWLGELVASIEKSAKFGMHTYPNGALCIGRRAHFEIGTEAWTYALYPGLPADILHDLEKDFGLRFANPDVLNVGIRRATGYSGPLPQVPGQYRSFLGYLNGARLFAGHLDLCGVRLTFNGSATTDPQPFGIADENIFRRPASIREDFLIIGGYRWDGSHLCATADSRNVYRVSREGRQILNVWDDLPAMLTCEIRRLQNLFSSDGRLVDSELPTVP